MLHEFITANRAEILRRARSKVAGRLAPKATTAEIEIGIPLFLDQLVATLAHGGDRRVEMDRDATLHGQRSHEMGFTVAQLVEDYGELCQSVTQLAIEMKAPIDTSEFKTLNRCLDDAIAQAVTEYGRVRDRSTSADEVQRLGFLAHELRNHLQTANLAFAILKTGTVAVGGSTGAVLDRSLAGMGLLVDRTLAQIRLDSGVDHSERVQLSLFLEELEAAGMISARNRGITLVVDRVELDVFVLADKQLFGSAVSNLLQNAIKFTKSGGHVHLRAIVARGRVTIAVEDECGGLQPT
jgi:signal transduction histidine kinase